MSYNSYMKTTRQSMNGKTETPSTVEAYKAKYRSLVAQQRALPLADQWTMASAIKDAKARAYVAMEALSLGQ